MIKNPSANVEESGSIPGSGRFPGEVSGNPLQYSCLENSMDNMDMGRRSTFVTKECQLINI